MQNNNKQTQTEDVGEMTDGKYLELCEQLKEMNEKREREEKIVIKKLYNYKHTLMAIYGLLTTADDLMSMSVDTPYEPMLLIDVACQKLKSFIDTDLLKIKTTDSDSIEILANITIENNNI